MHFYYYRRGGVYLFGNSVVFVRRGLELGGDKQNVERFLFEIAPNHPPLFFCYRLCIFCRDVRCTE